MKGLLKFAVFIFIFSFNLMILKADCDEAKIEANAVLEEVLNLQNGEVTTVRIKIHNMTINTYIVVLNDYNDDTQVYHYSDVDEDGILYFDSLDINVNINYSMFI